MLVSGEIENVPLLDLIQVVAYSKQTGILTVECHGTRGALVFEEGAVVCGESSSTKALLERAAAEKELRLRSSLRRVGALAVLTELLGQRSGSFRFQRTRGRVPDLAGVRLAPFYETGTLDTGELLLVLATAIDKPLPVLPAEAPAEKGPERRHTRYAPLVIPASLQLENSSEPSARAQGEQSEAALRSEKRWGWGPGALIIDGYLTNLSEGGGFFRGDRLPSDGTNAHLRFALPGNPGVIECRARVAWTRVDPKTGTIGAGLAFSEMGHEGRGRLAAYLARYQRLADECQDAQGEPVAG
jgi:hypothetical protein